MRRLSRGIALLATLAGTLSVTAPVSADPAVVTEAGPVLGAVMTSTSTAPASTAGDLTYHQGPLLLSTNVQPIFWGAAWGNPTFAGDKVSGLSSFYAGIGGSTYAGSTNEYTDASGAHVTSSITAAAAVFDPSAAPTASPSSRLVLSEIAHAVGKPAADTYYAIYSDQPLAGVDFCAWHSFGTVRGVKVAVGFFPSLDNVAACDPKDQYTGHSAALAALANVSGHELSEARTDPRGSGWYDASGAENADKCAWTFEHPYVTFAKNSTSWRIQSNWSNAAYDASTGYPNSSAQLGCDDGEATTALPALPV